MKIQLTLPSGEIERIDVLDFSLVCQCRHCDEEFLTRNPRQKYANTQHRKDDFYYRVKLRTISQ